jgi:hypothetical protein
MDPLVHFYDISDMIIQHFDYEEIFQLWKVSTLWHELILEKNKFAMRKIRLHIDDCNQDVVLQTLQNKDSKINTDLFELLKTKRKYQNVKIKISHGWDYTEELVRNLADSLVDIQVSADIYMEDIKITNLKILKLDNALLDGLTTSSTKLKKLSASLSGKELWLKRESPHAIKKALMKNEELSSLTLDAVLAEAIFSEKISPNFKLKELVVKCLKTFDEEIYENLRHFLSQQSKSLIYLQIQEISSFTLQHVFLN